MVVASPLAFVPSLGEAATGSSTKNSCSTAAAQDLLAQINAWKLHNDWAKQKDWIIRRVDGLNAELAALGCGGNSSNGNSGQIQEESASTGGSCTSTASKDLIARIETLKQHNDWAKQKDWIVRRADGLNAELATLGCGSNTSQSTSGANGGSGQSDQSASVASNNCSNDAAKDLLAQINAWKLHNDWAKQKDWIVRRVDGLNAELAALGCGGNSSNDNSGQIQEETASTGGSCTSTASKDLIARIETLKQHNDWARQEDWIVRRVDGLKAELAALECSVSEGQSTSGDGDDKDRQVDGDVAGLNLKDYKFQWNLPWLPASSKIDVCHLDVTGGECSGGSYDRLLLIVAPDKCIKGSVAARHLKYRGVALIGADFCPTGSSKSRAPSGRALSGGHTLRISFSTNGPTFAFVANVTFDARINNSHWGDFIQFGGSKTNTSHAMDLYLQNSYIYGHVGWSDNSGLAPKNAPHSDLIQAPYGHAGKVRIANVEAHWGYQTFFVAGDNVVNKRSNPNGTLELRNVAGYGVTDKVALGGTGIPSYARFILTHDPNGGGFRTIVNNVTYKPWGVYSSNAKYLWAYKPVGSVKFGTPGSVVVRSNIGSASKVGLRGQLEALFQELTS